MAGMAVRNTDVSWHPSSSRGRKWPTQGPFRVQARAGREVRNTILHHQPGWQGCSTVSLRGVAADRGKAGPVVEFQPHEEEVPGPHELLRAGGGDRRPGAVSDFFAVAGVGGASGGSSGGRGTGF